MRYADFYLSEFLKQDFVVRQRVPTIIHFSIVLLSTYLLLLVVWFASATFVEFAFLLLILLAILNGFMIWHVQRSRDLLLITEFQNALFSAAVGTSSMFSMIVRQDGAVMHIDAKFRALFPQIPDNMRRYLSDMFSAVDVNKKTIAEIYTAINDTETKQHIITMQTGKGDIIKVVLSIDPLRSMRDYALLRGRPYVERMA